MRACTAGHCTVRGLWCCVQMPSLRSPVHSVQPPVSDRETVKRPTLRIGWERPCSWSLRLSQIYASVEISRGGEDGWRAPSLTFLLRAWFSPAEEAKRPICSGFLRFQPERKGEN